jgi:hypothetical protein
LVQQAGAALGIELLVVAEQLAAGVAQEGDERSPGAAGQHSVGVHQLHAAAIFRVQGVNLAQDVVEEEARPVGQHPDFEALQGGVIGRAVEQAVADEPFD